MPSFNLGHEELTLLAWLLNYPTLPVLGPAPLGNIAADYRVIALAVAERSLRARGWLHKGRHGRLEVAPEIEHIIRLCAESPLAVMAARSVVGEDDEVVCFHLGRGEMAAHHRPEVGVHRLETLAAYVDISERIAALLWQDEPPPLDVPPIVASDSVIVQARQEALHKGEAAALKVLTRLRVEARTAVPLAESLAQPRSQITLVRIGPPGDGLRIGELSFLEGRRALWMMRGLTDHPGIFRVEVRAVSGHEAQTWIADWLEQAIGQLA